MNSYYVQNAPAGIHNLKLENRLEYATYFYYAWTGYDHFEVREVPTTELHGVEWFNSDLRNTAASWTAVQDREINYSKQSGTGTPVLVTINDTWGALMAAGNATGCQWMLYVDGAAVGRDLAIHPPADDGWLIYAGTMGWIVEGLDATPHYFDLRVYKHAGATQCLNGWSSHGYIRVYELDPTRSSFASDFSDVQHTTESWAAVSGRTVAYDKQEDATSTDLRVTWMDNTGYYYNSHDNACGYQLVMDGAPVALAQEHTSAIAGWRLKPTMAEFILRDVAVGSHTFELQWYSFPGASQCRNGWTPGNSASGASNFLLVRETPRND
jgi:hypothetical protein